MFYLVQLLFLLLLTRLPCRKCASHFGTIIVKCYNSAITKQESRVVYAIYWNRKSKECIGILSTHASYFGNIFWTSIKIYLKSINIIVFGLDPVCIWNMCVLVMNNKLGNHTATVPMPSSDTYFWLAVGPDLWINNTNQICTDLVGNWNDRVL